MRRVAVNLNGISIAYLMGFANAVLVCVMAFGVHMTDVQRAAVAGLVNSALVLAIHLGHRIGEAQATGQIQEVARHKMDKAATAETSG